MNGQTLYKAINILEAAYLADVPGILLYSGISTIQPGDLYFLGTNPGGRYDRTIRQTVADIESDRNEYLDARWGERGGGFRDVPGSAPIQRRVHYLLSQLGYETRQVAASNLVFARSVSESGLKNLDALAEACWPVHALFLETIQPKIILCMGSPAFDFIRERAGIPYNSRLIQEKDAQMQRWICRAVDLTLEGRQTRVIGLPHFSRYPIANRPQVARWAARLVHEVQAKGTARHE